MAVELGIAFGCGGGQDLAVGWRFPTLAAVAGVVALTMAGVVPGVLLGGLTGTLLGAVPGALAAVAAGYVPSRREAAERRRRTAQAWTAVSEPAADAVPGGKRTGQSSMCNDELTVALEGL